MNDNKNNTNDQLELPMGMYDYYYDEYQKTHNNSKTQEACWHTWKEYIGFTEKYKFCTKCDLKKPYEE